MALKIAFVALAAVLLVFTSSVVTYFLVHYRAWDEAHEKGFTDGYYEGKKTGMELTEKKYAGWLPPDFIVPVQVERVAVVPVKATLIAPDKFPTEDVVKHLAKELAEKMLAENLIRVDSTDENLYKNRTWTATACVAVPEAVHDNH